MYLEARALKPIIMKQVWMAGGNMPLLSNLLTLYFSVVLHVTNWKAEMRGSLLRCILFKKVSTELYLHNGKADLCGDSAPWGISGYTEPVLCCLPSRPASATLEEGECEFLSVEGHSLHSRSTSLAGAGWQARWQPKPHCPNSSPWRSRRLSFYIDSRVRCSASFCTHYTWRITMPEPSCPGLYTAFPPASWPPHSTSCSVVNRKYTSRGRIRRFGENGRDMGRGGKRTDWLRT